jgi:hypothetical protein
MLLDERRLAGAKGDQSFSLLSAKGGHWANPAILGFGYYFIL